MPMTPAQMKEEVVKQIAILKTKKTILAKKGSPKKKIKYKVYTILIVLIFGIFGFSSYSKSQNSCVGMEDINQKLQQRYTGYSMDKWPKTTQTIAEKNPDSLIYNKKYPHLEMKPGKNSLSLPKADKQTAELLRKDKFDKIEWVQEELGCIKKKYEKILQKKEAQKRIEVFIEQQELVLYLGDEILETYDIGVGAKVNEETPADIPYDPITKSMTIPGEYKICETIIGKSGGKWSNDYIFDKGDTELRYQDGIKGKLQDPFGSHWLRLCKKDGTWTGYGIHGTNLFGSMQLGIPMFGDYVSHGCIRMHNSDVEEIFNLVSKGTPVTIATSKEVQI